MNPPHTNEEGSLFFAGGVEASGVLARGVLLDLLRPEGADGAKVPLAICSKLDLTLYVARTHGPHDPPFGSGDIAVWLTWRQSQRLGADPGRHRYHPDLSDPLLQADWSAARSAAVWNALDPSLIAATVAYFHDHVAGGHVRVHAPVWNVAGGVGLTIGTRAALGPGEVSRFLDVYAATRWGVASVYVRDLEASGSRSFGYGAAVHALRVSRRFRLGVATDLWTEPAAADVRADDSGWHVAGEVDARLAGRWGLAVRLGSKSPGFLPGLPLADGPYGGLGVTVTW